MGEFTLSVPIPIPQTPLTSLKDTPICIRRLSRRRQSICLDKLPTEQYAKLLVVINEQIHNQMRGDK